MRSTEEGKEERGKNWSGKPESSRSPILDTRLWVWGEQVREEEQQEEECGFWVWVLTVWT